MKMLDDLDVRALASQGWRRQLVADERLARKLASLPRPEPFVKPPMRGTVPVQLTLEDLFLKTASVDRDADEGGGSSRANSEGGRSPNPLFEFDWKNALR